MVSKRDETAGLAVEVERLKEQYRRLVESISEGVVVLTPEGVIASVSTIVEQMSGWSAGELIGSSWQSLIHPADIPNFIDHLQRLANGAHLPPVQVRVLQKSGEYHPVEIQAQAEVEDGRTTGVWTLTRDLTKDEQLKHQASELRQERQRVRLLIDLIRAAAVRAASPLSTINLAAYSLAQQSASSAALTSIERIEHNVRHLARLVARVLAMAELDADRTHFAFAPVNLNRLANYLQINAASVADASAITLETEISPTLPPVRADELQLYRAIQEVFVNAIQHTPELGKILIKTFQRGRFGVLEVQDTGSGIPSERLPHLFERFHSFSLPASGLEKLGLGLPMAKKIVDKHDGSLEIVSTPGEGSTITIAIPLYTA